MFLGHGPTAEDPVPGVFHPRHFGFSEGVAGRGGRAVCGSVSRRSGKCYHRRKFTTLFFSYDRIHNRPPSRGPGPGGVGGGHDGCGCRDYSGGSEAQAGVLENRGPTPSPPPPPTPTPPSGPRRECSYRYINSGKTFGRLQRDAYPLGGEGPVGWFGGPTGPQVPAGTPRFPPRPTLTAPLHPPSSGGGPGCGCGGSDEKDSLCKRCLRLNTANPNTRFLPLCPHWQHHLLFQSLDTAAAGGTPRRAYWNRGATPRPPTDRTSFRS